MRETSDAEATSDDVSLSTGALPEPETPERCRYLGAAGLGWGRVLKGAVVGLKKCGNKRN